MDWKAKAEAYKKIGRTPAGAAEDEFVARKILRGLGWTEKSAPFLCSLLTLDAERPLLDIAVDVLDSVSGGMFGVGSLSRRFVVDARRIGLSKSFLAGDTVKSLCASAMSLPENGGVLTFFRNPKDKAKCMTAVFLHEPKEGYLPEWLLRPVATLAVRHGNASMWIRETMPLISDMAEVLRWAVPDRPDGMEDD